MTPRAGSKGCWRLGMPDAAGLIFVIPAAAGQLKGHQMRAKLAANAPGLRLAPDRHPGAGAAMESPEGIA